MTRRTIGLALLLLGVGCSAQEGGRVEGAVVAGGPCRLSGSAHLAQTRVPIAFDTGVDPMTGMVTFGDASSGQFVATGGPADCDTGATGTVARLDGTGTFRGVPGHTFVAHATHVSPVIATASGGAPSIDAFFIMVFGPDGTVTTRSGGFVDTDFVAAPLPATRACTITGSTTLPTGDAISIDGAAVPGTPVSGTLTVLRAPGAGRRTRVAGTVGDLRCRDTSNIFLTGEATLNGEAGYSFVVVVHDDPREPSDSVDVRIFDGGGVLVERVLGEAPAPGFVSSF